MSGTETPAQQAEQRMREVDQGPDESDAATPLDLLLTDATRSPLRRFLPGMSGVRFTAGLARTIREIRHRAGPGVRIILVSQAPEMPFNAPACLARSIHMRQPTARKRP